MRGHSAADCGRAAASIAVRRIKVATLRKRKYNARRLVPKQTWPLSARDKTVDVVCGPRRSCANVYWRQYAGVALWVRLLYRRVMVDHQLEKCRRATDVNRHAAQFIDFDNRSHATASQKEQKSYQRGENAQHQVDDNWLVDEPGRNGTPGPFWHNESPVCTSEEMVDRRCRDRNSDGATKVLYRLPRLQTLTQGQRCPV